MSTQKEKAPRTAATVQSAKGNTYHSHNTGKAAGCQVVKLMPQAILNDWIITVNAKLDDISTVVIEMSVKEGKNIPHCGIFTNSADKVPGLIIRSFQEYANFLTHGPNVEDFWRVEV